MRESVAELEAMGFFGDADIERGVARERHNAIDYGNPATRELVARVPGMEHWLALIPTARALEPLYRPQNSHLAGGQPIGLELREWFCNVADALGLRNRAAMLRCLLDKQPVPSGSPQWLSLACGAARPMLDSAVQSAHRPQLTLVDLSRNALADAQGYARSLGIDAQVRTLRLNVLDRRGLPLPEATFDVVEAIGILEYLKPDDNSYQYRQVAVPKRVQAGATTLLRNAWRLLRPGGSLIVGNMLVDRPELGFTLNVVQWPHINPRTITEMHAIFDAAELDGPHEVVLAEETEQRIYALYRISKPG